MTIVEAISHEIGAFGLWCTIKHILQNLAAEDAKYILICEEDHQFSANYSKDILFESIFEAQQRKADVLLGGLSWFQNAFKVSNNLFWVVMFSGTQFTIIFKDFFNRILASELGDEIGADYKFCLLTDRRFFIYPFISIQKDYGYSDATLANNEKGLIKRRFDHTVNRLQLLDCVFQYHESRQLNWNYDVDFTIPTFVLGFSDGIEVKQHIENQFRDRGEFDISIIEVVNNKFKAVNKWINILSMVKLAIKKDHDVIIICDD